MDYIALGDSITVDDYPDIERGTKNNGAASITRVKIGATRYLNLSRDGATIADVRRQLLKAHDLLENDPKRSLVISITAGGNDISFGMMHPSENAREAIYMTLMSRVIRQYTDLVLATRKMFPDATLILNTLYDPTDGTGELPENCGAWAEIAPYYSSGRRELGKYILEWGSKLNFARVVDIFKAFDGKGMKIQNREGYYYDPFLIEPGAKGAEIISDMWTLAAETVV